MATSFFDEKTNKPGETDILQVLETKKSLWDELIVYINENYENATGEWKFYGKKSGWTLVFKSKTRTLLYLFPCNGYFKIMMVFGENAVNAAKESSLPQNIIDSITGAQPHTEGRSFFVDISEAGDLEHIKTLLQLKFC